MKLGRSARLALVVAASFLAHLKGISSPPLDYHYHRQVNTAAIARNFHRHGLHLLSPEIDWNGGGRQAAATEFPLYMWLTGLFWPLGGLGDLWGRLLSIAFSAATAVYLYLFLEKKTGERAACFSAVLFSAIPLEIYFGRTVQPEALALLGTMAALYHWDRELEAPSFLHWSLAAGFAFLAIAHKLPYAYILMPLGILAWIRRGPKSLASPRLWGAGGAALLGVFLWYHHASSGVYVVPAHAGEFGALLDYGRLAYYTQFQFFSRYPELAATYAGVFLAALGFRETVLRRGQVFYAWWLAAIAIYLVACGGYAFHHEYTSLPFVPVNAALMGVGLDRLWDRKRGLAACLALAIPAQAAFRIHHWYRLNHPELAHAREAADAVSRLDDLFLGNERASSVPLYYLDRKGWSWELAEAGEKRIGDVEGVIAKGAKFFMTEKSGPFAGRDGFYANYFYSRYPVVWDRNGILIFKLEPKAAALSKS